MTPLGQYVLSWEQRHVDAAVTDLFGFHALQWGLPELQGLQINRMPHRWYSNDMTHTSLDLRCDSDALPFANQSLDLVVLPHTLESAPNPHHALREVERVLMPEGRVVILGFNPASLWGVRQHWGRTLRRLACGPESSFFPEHFELIGQRRLRDWLHLLNLEVDGGGFGCYRPPFSRQTWLNRCAWMEAAGDRWWPVLGGVYLLVAVKRVRGMRLVGLAKQLRLRPRTVSSVVAQRDDGYTPRN